MACPSRGWFGKLKSARFAASVVILKGPKDAAELEAERDAPKISPQAAGKGAIPAEKVRASVVEGRSDDSAGEE